MDSKQKSYALFVLTNRLATWRRRLCPTGSRREIIYSRYVRPVAASILATLAHGNQRVKRRATRASFLNPAVIITTNETPNRREVMRILVMKTDHIGDFIFGLQAFRLLRQTFPAAHITLLCGAWNRDIAAASGFFDEIITINVYKKMSGAALSLAPDPTFDQLSAFPVFDIALDLKVEPDSRFLLGCIEAHFKAGFDSPLMPPDMSLVIPSFPLMRPEAVDREVHTRTLLTILISAVAAIFDSQQATEQGIRKIAASSTTIAPITRGQGPVIGINPGSGGTAKNWPLSYVIECTRRCIEEHDATVVVLGTAAEKEAAKALVMAVKSDRLLNYTEKLSLIDFTGFVQTLDLYIGNDTGSTHVAAALNVPTICLFSGSAPLGRVAPVGEHLCVIHVAMPCAPCGLKNVEDCRHEHRCMTAITVDQVMQKAVQFLQK